MVNNHGFADGNKRTTIILAHTLIVNSGDQISAADADELIDDAFEQMVLAAATGAMTLEEITNWFKARIRRTLNLPVSRG